MATVRMGTVVVELSLTELELILRALAVVPNSDAYEHADEARKLRGDLDVVRND